MTTLYTKLRARRPHKTAFKRRTYVSPTVRAYLAMQEAVIVAAARTDAAKRQFESSSKRLVAAWAAGVPPSLRERFAAWTRRFLC